MDKKTGEKIMRGLADHAAAEAKACRKHPQRVVYKMMGGGFHTKIKGALTARETQSGKYWNYVVEPREMRAEDLAELKKIERQRKALFRKEQKLLERAHLFGSVVSLDEGIAITDEREGRQ